MDHTGEPKWEVSDLRIAQILESFWGICNQGIAETTLAPDYTLGRMGGDLGERKLLQEDCPKAKPQRKWISNRNYRVSKMALAVGEGKKRAGIPGKLSIKEGLPRLPSDKSLGRNPADPTGYRERPALRIQRTPHQYDSGNHTKNESE